MLILFAFVSTVNAQTNNIEKSKIKIANFGRIDDHYYRGAQPKNSDYQDLAALGIMSVITLTSDDTDPNEKVLVEKTGMKFYQIPMDSKIPPTPSQLAEFLRIVNDRDNQPVYVHCAAGKHRTGVMSAAYRLSHYGWTADQAYDEMKQYKFGLALFHPKLKSFVYDYYQKLTHATKVLDPAIAAAQASN
ncbi:MAG TPA: dual specificity protein phosphatase family protein [Acidobacteriota bacterium]|nr:dual specificity protein phosphatase family protein [Acidobacteriota bacterium]